MMAVEVSDLIGLWEHVAYWIGLTQDQKIWGLIPTAGHVQKYRANISFLTAFTHEAVMVEWETSL